MKKKIKILGIATLVLLLVLTLLPFIFKGKIVEIVKQTANNSINATLDFKSADLSLIRAFPNIKLQLHDFYIVNKVPFSGDTLVSAANVALELPFKSLFNDASEAIHINHFNVDRAALNLRVDSLGNANYDIALKNGADDPGSKSTSEGFSFNLNTYAFTNSSLTFNDVRNQMSFALENLEHSGNGSLSSDESILATQSKALASFQYDNINYLNNQRLLLDAELQINLIENRYTFLENSAKINELPLVFDGFLQIYDEHQEVNISFKTPSSDFKNFLAIVPDVYSKNIEDVTTTGNFDITGNLNGVIDEKQIPKFNIAIASKNASFKYPDLPKALKNIFLDTKIVNTTGQSKDTYIDISKLSFQIDDEVFNANARLSDLTANMKVNARLDGTVDLAKLEQVYPAEGLKNLQGILTAAIATNFDMNSLETKRYEDTRTSGRASINNFEFTDAAFKNPLKIETATLNFTPSTVALSNFKGQTGQTDLALNGSLKNVLGFLFAEQDLVGNLNMSSNNFVVNDFMSNETIKTEKSTPGSKQEKLKIPSFLDVIINGKASSVVYDNITLKNVSGNLKIKDQVAALENMKSQVFNGQLGFNGNISTQTETPTFDMNLNVKNFDIAQSFSSLDLFKALAPIANAINGKINTDIRLSGNLQDNYTPELSSVSGNMLAQLFSAKINSEKTPLLTKLSQKLNFFDGDKLNLENLKASITFKDGKVAIKPFTVNYEDVEIAVGGSHGFDKTIDYDAIFNVPAKYLGKEAEQLLAQLSIEEQDAIKVPVTALLTGSFGDPKIATDLKSAISDLTKQVANNQKNKLIDKGKDKLGDALDKLLNKDTSKTDTVKTNDKVKETAKGLLEGLFGKKKKDTARIKKDTVN